MTNKTEHGRGEYRPRPSQDSHEWYTPQHIIDLAHAVMGGIDLDPASSRDANQVVGADLFYDKELDGLSLKWHGRIWLNPPYGANRLTERWWNKLLEEYDAGRVTEALFLANATTETRWFQEAVGRFVALLIRRRLSFWRTGGDSKTGFFGSVLVYLPPRAGIPLASPAGEVPLALSGGNAPLRSDPMPLSPDDDYTTTAAGVARFVGLASDLGQIITAI